MGNALRKEDVEVTYTYADYKEWELKEGERYELIHGVAYAMSAPSTYNQLIAGEMFRQIANYLAGKPCKVIPAPYDVRLFYEEDESDSELVQPDISVICDKEKRGPEGCQGPPTWWWRYSPRRTPQSTWKKNFTFTGMPALGNTGW